MQTVLVKINSPYLGFPAGREIPVKVDSKGVPLERDWRRRFKDAEQDNCLQIIPEKPINNVAKKTIKKSPKKSARTSSKEQGK